MSVSATGEDPVGVVVEMIMRLDPSLDRSMVTGVVARVAGGRDKRRRLAAGLSERPAVLTDGRSPAAQVIGDLLVALRKAGVASVSPPHCAECGRDLKTLERTRDGSWYCTKCHREMTPLPCASCGQTRVVAGRDRKGQPRCSQCPDRDGRDPVAVLTAVVTQVDDSVSADVVAAAASRVFTGPARLRRLAWILEDRPGLLAGDGAQAPTAAVLRFISELTAAGATRIVAPDCPGCHQAVRLFRRVQGLWHCSRCVARAIAVPCSRCGMRRPTAIRDENQRPVCSHCQTNDPRNHETCASCGQHRPVNLRTPQGPLCHSCRPRAQMTCAICGQARACDISRATGLPWCGPCQKRWAQCTGCGDFSRIRGGTLSSPLCAACTRSDSSFWRGCPVCGDRAQLQSGPCRRCTLKHRLQEFLDDGTGGIRPELQVLRDNFASTPRPRTALRWLAENPAAAVLGAIARRERPLSHAALDELPPSPQLENLRRMLVATGALPARDEYLTQLQHWITQVLADHADPGERRLLHRYAVWYMLRRLRQRNHGNDANYPQVDVIRQQLRAAIALLGWLRARGRTLETCRQADLDEWLARDGPGNRSQAGHFVRWAAAHRVNPALHIAATRWTGPVGPLDQEQRWHNARRLLHDDSIDTAVRVAGLLLLLYAQMPSAISRLTLDDIDTSDERQVRIRLGRTPVKAPEPLAALIRDLAANRHGHAVLGDTGTSPWLFPGGHADRPVGASSLASRLHKIGIHPAQDRSTALFQLATEVPAAVLARTLGIHVKVATQWQQASAGDWGSYAADVSRRHQRQPVPSRHETPDQA